MPSASLTSAMLEPPRMSRNEAQARTLLAQRGGGFTFSLAGKRWQADVYPVVGPDALTSSLQVLELEWAGAQLCLHLPSMAIEQVLQATLGGALLPELAPEWTQLALQAGLTELFELLQTLGRGTPQVRTSYHCATAPASALPHALAMRIQISDGPQTVAAVVFTDTLGLLLLAGLVARRPPRPDILEVDLPLHFHAELGYTMLGAMALGSLTAGDAVLLDQCYLGAEQLLWLQIDGRCGIHVQYQPAKVDNNATTPPTLTVIQPWTTTMPVTSPTTPHHPTPVALDDVPVRLSFDVGDLVLTLAQVRALQPGQALELGHPLAGAVRIRANGALIGEGDLIDINGELGVSIRHLFNQPS